MEKLIQGVQHFQSRIHYSQRELFERLADGQKPLALFVTCSDSRVNPNLITQTKPGELFIMRNAGNMVPPYGASSGGEAATVEFAVAGLYVRDVIVCGHSHCGAIAALLNPSDTDCMPAMVAWLGHAEATRRIVRENCPGLSGEKLREVAAEQHVLAQLDNLRTHPSVAAACRRGELSLHGWIYRFEKGEVLAYSADEDRFVTLVEPGGDDDVAARSLARSSSVAGSAGAAIG
jgi:carbonic anhydrase